MTMAHRMSHQVAAFSKPGVRIGKFRCGLTLLLAIALTLAPPHLAIGQIDQQQQREERQREEQARAQQQREQEQREQQERDRQAREQQQREQQQREEQARAQQQREHEQREQQERDRQAREQQQQEQQAREQQQRDDQQRQQQAREQANREQANREQERQKLGAASKVSPSVPSTNSPGAASSAAAIHTGSAPQPKPKPVAPDPHAKNCKDKDQPCPVCRAGQSPGKNNSCQIAPAAKTSGTPTNTPAAAQACPAGQVWNGVQCTVAGAQQCLAGQSVASASCQLACTMATAGAQGYIELLRMARQDKDAACMKNPMGQECQSAEASYDMRLNEYRAVLGGVPIGCTLPDPISI